MAIGPWDPLAAAASGHMRASDADRDRVVDTLKAAYVYGLLTREELAACSGQAGTWKGSTRPPVCRAMVFEIFVIGEDEDWNLCSFE